MRIKQSLGDDIHGDWKWTPDSNLYPVTTVLEGSQFSVEMTSETDPNSPDFTPYVPMSFWFVESDPGSDQTGSHYNPIGNSSFPAEPQRVKKGVYVAKTFGTCVIVISYDRQFSLIRNIRTPGQNAVFAPVDS